MADNGWAIESLCVLYDLTADKRWLDEAMKLFERNVTLRWKNFGSHLHKPVMVQGQDYLPFDKSYCYFIMPLCGLHARTGNKEIERLLIEGCETPFPESFYDAPMYLAALFAYTYTVTDNEAYLKQALNLFAQGFPESATLPIVMPGDNTWSELSAMRIRAAWPIYYALWHKEQKQLQKKN
jgi:uncharacterized protein YyaL (SSP411 family)